MDLDSTNCFFHCKETNLEVYKRTSSLHYLIMVGLIGKFHL
jgi:hypothetical protein